MVRVALWVLTSGLHLLLFGAWPVLAVALVLIDHAILSPGSSAAATRERTVAGSDHRMITVTFVL